MSWKLLTVKCGRHICGWAWARHWPDSPDTGNWSPWQRWRWHTAKLSSQTGDSGYILYAGQPSHWDQVWRREKKGISLPLLSSNSMPRIALQGLSGGKLITPFDWWCLTRLERLHTGAWFTCAPVLETGPEQSAGLQHLKLLGNSEEDLNFHL